MAHRVEAADMWRNFVPVAPDIQVTFYKNKGGFIDLSEYLIQGARDLVNGDPDMSVIDRLGTQRGWLCSYYVTADPEYGRAINSNRGQGFDYLPMQNFIGRDCFSYVVNNGTQTSAPGKITVTLEDYYSLRINVAKRNSTPNSADYMFTGNYYIPDTLGPWDDVGMSWFQIVPYRSDLSGTPTIYYNRVPIDATEWGMTSPEKSSLYKSHRAYKTPWLPSSWPTANLRGIDSRTGRPYRQPDGPYPIELEVTFVAEPRFNYGIYYGYWFMYWAKRETLTFSTEALGSDWWSNGSVIDADTSTWDTESGGAYIPNLSGGDADAATLPGPQVIGMLPAISSTDSPINSFRIRMVFDRNISAGNGFIVLHRVSDDAVIEFIPLVSITQVNITQNVLVVTMSVTLEYSTDYYITVGTDALYDNDLVYYAGVQSTSEWVFRTRVDPSLPPVFPPPQ